MDEIAKAGKVERIDSGDSGVQVGQWYWMNVKVDRDVWFDRPVREGHARAKAATEPHMHDFKQHEYRSVKERALLCVTSIGSNYVELKGSPYESQGDGRWHEWRVHFKDFAKLCTLEPDAKRVVQGFILQHRQAAAALMAEVQQEMEKLGVVPRTGIDDSSATELSGTSTALAKSNGVEVRQYKRDLMRAQRIDIPHLFERIKVENKLQATWMKAEMLPLLAHVGKVKPIEKAIEARLLNVELYAGLVEEVKQVREGDPAPLDTPVHLLQRRHYMDEECLANYQAGGMDYKSVDGFDGWLAKPDNFYRVLPFPRCVVAFRIRRHEKERHGSTMADWIRISAEKKADESTFLYMRNGDRLYRLETQHDFGARLFPDFDTANASQTQLHFREHRDHDSGTEYQIISDERLKGMREDEAAQTVEKRALFNADKAKAVLAGEEWTEGKEWTSRIFNYRYRVEIVSTDFEPLNTDTVYYDDVVEDMAKQVRAHNRVAMVLQGLMDRSDVFHPHPRWQLWDAEGFEKAIRLVYDDSRALSPGPRPDFEAYRARLNATLTKGSMVTGQDAPWLEREREKEYERRRGNWRLSYDEKKVSPYWRPPYDGPELVHAAESVGKDGVRFKWERERMTQRSWNSRGDTLAVTFTAPVKRLLNVSAYTPGDFKQFYADPRTRAEYLQWAPLLLAAEDWHAAQAKKRKGGEK